MVAPSLSLYSLLGDPLIFMTTMHKAHRRRGGSLALVLVIATLGFLAAFVLAGTTSAHLNFANRSSRVARARLLAEAAVTRAVVELQKDSAYGALGEGFELELPGNPAGSVGKLGFAPDVVANLSLAPETTAYSTYNLDADTSTPGFQNRLVPAHSVHLVGEGTCLGVTRRVEAIVCLPPFPYAIASSGPIESQGELLVGSLNGQTSPGTITADDLLPAHVASNDAEATSVTLGPRSVVVGDIRSVGGLNLSEGVVVKGQTLAYGEPVALPKVPLQDYDPEGRQTGYQQLPSEISDATVAGTARSSGDLTVYGELDLDQAKLYVDGHLTVRGPISGQGLVVARQGATIYTGARLSGGQAVLLSGGDVTIAGGGPLGSFFQGLVYAEGAFEARDITVVGSFIARGEGASVKLSNARVLGDTEVTHWTPTSSHTFYFVPGSRHNEPAIQVAEPTDDSFAIRARVAVDSSGDITVEVDDPRTGETKTYHAIHPAARGIAVVANEVGRDLLLETPAQHRPGGRNLVAAAETLEQTLTGLVEDTAGEHGTGFDLNKFLSVSDRLRVTLWREL